MSVYTDINKNHITHNQFAHKSHNITHSAKFNLYSTLNQNSPWFWSIGHQPKNYTGHNKFCGTALTVKKKYRNENTILFLLHSEAVYLRKLSKILKIIQTWKPDLTFLCNHKTSDTHIYTINSWSTHFLCSFI